MKRFFLIIIHLISFFAYSQCFDCAKNYGGWTDETTRDLDVDINGNIYLTYSAEIVKHNSNCEVLWTKSFNGIPSVYISSLTTDVSGNVYVLIDCRISGNASVGPFNSNGIICYRGLNVIKFDSSGNVLWSRYIGDRVSYILQRIFNVGNEIYITGTFYDNININGQISFNFPYTDHPRAFVAKYDLTGNFINAKYFGDGIDDYISSEIDDVGNVYLTKKNINNAPNYARSIIEKISPTLQNIWTKEISNNNNGNSLYIPTSLYYNSTNDKLYLWGAFNLTVNVLGNYFSTNTGNAVFQSLLSEFNTSDGSLERISRYDNFSQGSLPGVNGSYIGNIGYMSHKNNTLYILTSFRSTMDFSNQSITSSSYVVGGVTYFAEDLVLFKVDLNNFSNQYIFKSNNQTPYINGYSKDFAGQIGFNNNDLFITSRFTSKPIEINNTIINNNSGNQNSDVLFYKFNINGVNSGQINYNNTCLNESTQFELNGNYDSITWNFGDPSSLSNTATISNPQHQFSTAGNYNITATVTCGSDSQIVEGDIVISDRPIINTLPPIEACETVSGSGICSEFDTTTINYQLIGSQQNVILEFRNANGVLLPSPLPNPYTNSTVGSETITARVFFNNNPNCYLETLITFNTISKPIAPIVTASQIFCHEQNATLTNIIITGQNVKWYDALTGGNLLVDTTLLQDGVTYYASQTLTVCESSRAGVTIQIQNTPGPSGTDQQFCAIQNSTLADVVVSGTAINWYATNSSTVVLPLSTIVSDATTYYATQTVNGCESIVRLPITISLIYTLNAVDYSTSICDNGNNGNELSTLSDYNSFLINSVVGNSFTFYKTNSGAENLTASDFLNDNQTLVVGLNTFYIRIDSNNGCHQIVKLALTLISEPIISIKDELILCENKSITVKAGSSFSSYAWSTGATTSSIGIADAGNYSVTVTKNHGSLVCSNTKNFTVILSNSPTISSIDIVDWTDNQNSITINLSASSIGDYEYSIDGFAFQSSNVFSGLLNGEYTVTVKDLNECGIATKEVYLLNYQHFFTPNGDGHNDTWYIKFSQLEPNLEVRIFNRYGKLLKIMNNQESWDGTFNGQLLPADDYWFYVTRNDKRIHKGHFAMKR